MAVFYIYRMLIKWVFFSSLLLCTEVCLKHADNQSQSFIPEHMTSALAGIVLINGLKIAELQRLSSALLICSVSIFFNLLITRFNG